MREVKLSSSILPICRKDVRGVACIALATPSFTYVYIKDHIGSHVDECPTDYLDFWPFGLLAIWTSGLWASGIMVLWTSGIPDF